MNASPSTQAVPLKNQPWIYSSWLDGAFILSPAFIVTALVLLLPEVFSRSSDIPTWIWVSLIVAIDVAHVYSTLFRTYLDPEELLARKNVYTFVPLLAWIAGVMLFSYDSIWFWRTLAYLAVFHFIRQQYGFVMIYSRREPREPRLYRRIDQATIYAATLYPLIYWHTHLPRNFSWFVAGDFLSIPSTLLETVAHILYAAILITYACKEIAASIQRHSWNLPKNALVAGTALSWYVGIVGFNGDLAFTATNVVSHGLPYMALIWIYSRNKSRLKPEVAPFPFSRWKTPILLFCGFLMIPLALSFFEEGLWDGFIWRDHTEFFIGFSQLPKILDQGTLALVVPLLALPQMTHYILDGFIWRIHGNHSDWKQFVFAKSR